MINLFFPVIIISFISAVLCSFNIESSKPSYLIILPISVLLISIPLKKIYKHYKNSIVFFLVILQVVFRYCLLPLILSKGGDFRNGYQSFNLNISIMIMIIELLSTFIVLFLLSNLQSNSYIHRTNRVIPIKPSLFLSLMLICMLYYIYTTGVFMVINPVWDLQDFVETVTTKSTEISYNPYGRIVFESFKVLLALLIISIVYKSHRIKERSKKWLYLIIIIVSNLFIIGLSRFSMIFFTLPLLILIRNFLNKKDFNKILFITGITTVCTLLIASLAKFTRGDNEASIDSFFSPYSINAYFAGPGNIATGIDIYNNPSLYEHTTYLLNDTIQNIPLLSKLTIDNYKVNILFNEQIYGHRDYADQIVPLSVSGLFHFGYLGVSLYSAFFLIIALYMERLSYRTKELGYRYVYIYLSIALSLVFMLNIGSFYSNLVSAYLFIFSPLYIAHKYSSIKLHL